ncbi:glutamine--fructose-6-phosphate transaminase (isomerizing) [bacterium 1XD42-94]|nr:glutamine--fructose-6-phosphate transaminase (isomerizing) [bacterium 1XD42-76]NBK04617.1 glutamine--fructose-6-phosphate transaminase (isomerizing) [bacterium 1XD42-94]
MCGIIGYCGPLDAQGLILEGLSQLEYRGYDSAGIALFDEESHMHFIKKVGKVAALKEACAKDPILSHCGIGHTRWATHGGVTGENTHPHTVGNVTMIHNGIIENYHALTENYHLQGKLKSQTDTEVAAAVLNELYTGDPLGAIREFLGCLEGSYSFCIMFEDRPGEIYAVRNMSPLVAAYTGSGAFIASDLTALLPYSRSYFVVPEQKIVKLTAYTVLLYDPDGRECEPEILTASWNTNAAMKNGFPHFMLKEIHEQPEVFKNTILPRLNKGLPDFSDENIPDELLKNVTGIRIIACGTAMHAGMVARALMEPRLRIPVTVSVASEFRYEEPLIDDSILSIVISQSGETIDTLAALRLARESGSKVISIVNVKGSTIARESDYVIYTHGGPEIAVASTKAYTVQIAALYLLFCRMALARGVYSEEHAQSFTGSLLACAPAMEAMIQKKTLIQEIVTHIVGSPDAFFIGRGMDYAFSLEGALKLKEISYIHAEAYAAGELKHGTIALIADHVPVVAIATQTNILAKTISNIREVKARGAYVILIVTEGTRIDNGLADVLITLPATEDKFTVFPIAAVLQLIAYYASVQKGLDVDQPRNLAKSVTVE